MTLPLAPRPLSPQQKQIMQYLADGLTMKEIQLKMGIKLDTVRTYIRRVRGKVGAKSLYHCIAIVVARGEITVSGVTPLDETSA